jgi:hypothetical protein
MQTDMIVVTHAAGRIALYLLVRKFSIKNSHQLQDLSICLPKVPKAVRREMKSEPLVFRATGHLSHQRNRLAVIEMTDTVVFF